MKASKNNFRFFAASLGITAPLWFMSGAALADPFMNITFSGDTVGQPPATNTNTALPITQPYALGGYDPDPDPNNGAEESPPTAADGTILVGNPDGMPNAAVMTTNPDDNQIGALWMDTEYNVTSELVKLSFEVDIISGSPTTAQTKTLNGDPTQTVGVLLGINSFDAGNTGFDFAAAPTSGSGGIFGLRSPTSDNLTSFFNYSDDTPYNVEIDANYGTGLMNAYVNGTLEASNLPMVAGIDPAANPDETFIFENGELGYANSVALTNIEASVPEPASTGVLIFAGAAALMRRRRRLA
jgi:hypothetical protein